MIKALVINLVLFVVLPHSFAAEISAYHLIGVDSNNDGYESNILVGIEPVKKQKISLDFLSQVRNIGNSELKDSIYTLNHYYSGERFYFNTILGVNSESTFLPKLKYGGSLYYALFDSLEVNIGYTISDYALDSVGLLRVGVTYRTRNNCSFGLNNYLSSQSESVYSLAIMNSCEWSRYGYRGDFGFGETFADIGLKDDFFEGSLFVYRKHKKITYGLKFKRYTSNYLNESYVGVQFKYFPNWGNL